jgi:hypothetical protein
MTRRPLLGLSALAILGAGIGWATPSLVKLQPPEVLGATTTITAFRSGTAEVALYDDARLPADYLKNPDVSIAGPGRLVGFSLVRADASDELTALRLPGFAGGDLVTGGSQEPAPTCTSYPDSTVPVYQSCSSPSHPMIVLHEGDYLLTVLTDGGPLRITLRLPGLQLRSATVRVQNAIRTVERPLTLRESLGPDSISYGGRRRFPASRRSPWW